MVDAISHITSHPALLAVLAIIGILALFFLLRKLFKLALILILILLVSFGLYYGFKTPGTYPDKIRGAYDKTKMKSGEILNKGKDKIVEEGKKMTRSLDRNSGDR